MSAQRTGTNGPSLPVPPEEESTPAAAAAGGAGEGAGAEDPWGDAEAGEAEGGAAAADPFADAVVDPFADPAAEPAAAASEFSDAVAVQIPSQVPIGARKPYFIFGDGQSPVDLWFLDLARSEPLQFTGKGSADVTPNTAGEVTGVASYDEGEWSVIFKRPLRPDSGARLAQGEFMPLAFSVWDGLSRERGNRRGLTAWYSLYLEPEAVPSAVGPMIRTALLILAIELAVIAWVRRRYASGGRAEADSETREQPATSA
jgi:DMSO reductase family type II enzyme heme b subunit